MSYRWRCYYCGRFIGWHEAHYEWTPYGGYLDVDPPDECFAHVTCYEKEPYGKTWIGPTLHKDHKVGWYGGGTVCYR